MTILSRLFGRTEPVISDASVRDAAAMAKLHAVSFQRGWSDGEFESLLLDRATLAHRATVGRTLAGFVLSRIVADEAEILSIAVAPARRSRGVAGALLQRHLGRLAGLGVRTVFLEVAPDNAPAQRLYARAGFREVGRRPDYYPQAGGGSVAALVLRRDLA